MSHTNETTYYGLPQYVGTDIIDPLVDTNGAYSAIDTALHNVAGSAGQASTDASQAVAAVEAMGTTVSGHTTAIEANAQAIQKVSDAVADTFSDSATYAKGKVVWYNGKTYQFTAPHSGAWTGLDVVDFVADDAIAGAEASVETINTKLGNTDISAIGDGSVTGAIDTVNADVSGVKTALGNTDISSIGDGSVTGAIDTLNTDLAKKINYGQTTPESYNNVSLANGNDKSITATSDGLLVIRVEADSSSGALNVTTRINDNVVIANSPYGLSSVAGAFSYTLPVYNGDVIKIANNGKTVTVSMSIFKKM